MTNRTMLKMTTAAAATALMALAAGAVAAQNGPVAQSCAAELTKYCSDKPHVKGEARACLDANRDKLSEGCRHALDTTGPGRGGGGGAGPRN